MAQRLGRSPCATSCPARGSTPPAWRYTYCPVRQIALVHDEDGALVPLLRHTQPGPTPGSTSGGGDGQGPNPPPEEVGSPDYQTS